MRPPSNIFWALFATALLSILIIDINYVNVSSPASNFLPTTNMATLKNLTSSSSYPRFNNPVEAYYIMEKLDIFEAVTVPKESKSKYEKPFNGFKANDDYCAERRAYIVNHPESIFEGKNFITNYWTDHNFITQLLPKIGKDLNPKVSVYMPKEKKDKPLYNFKPEAHMFFTVHFLFNSRVIGKQFSCLSQISNHIPGHEVISRKDSIGSALRTYADAYKSRSDCFNYNKFFPKTWVLSKKDQCEDFFNEFNSENYTQLKKERGVVYFQKIGAGVHEGQGVAPVNNDVEFNLRKLYNNGKLCGKIEKNLITQYNIYNPLLLHGHKFDFRVFMLIASTNPTIAYYHDGYLRVSLHEYDANSTELGAHLTNTALSKSIFKEAKKNGTYNGLSLDQIKRKSYWLYPELHGYLMEQGLVTDNNWVDNYLKPELKRGMIHLVRMAQKNFMKKSSVSEIYGVDFMMDENLNLWYIEANAQPLLQGWNSERAEFFNNMLSDSFDVVFGLLKSRMERVINYINKLAEETGEFKVSTDGISIPQLGKRRKEFEKISMNYFEEKYEPGYENGFEKIIDDNVEGKERYFGLLEEKCLAY